MIVILCSTANSHVIVTNTYCKAPYFRRILILHIFQVLMFYADKVTVMGKFQIEFCGYLISQFY